MPPFDALGARSLGGLGLFGMALFGGSALFGTFAAAARGDAREPTPVGTFADWLEAAAAGAGE